MFSVAPNIVLAPNMTQNAERKHKTQNTNTAPIRPHSAALAMTVLPGASDSSETSVTGDKYIGFYSAAPV